MDITTILDYLTKQEEQIVTNSTIEIAKIQGFYQGAAQAVATVKKFIEDNKEEKAEEKPAKTK